MTSSRYIEMGPQHLAIIMDGNRRWARQHAFDIAIGHDKGADNLRAIGKIVAQKGVEHLTVFAFSSENWKRNKREVDSLLALLRRFLTQELDELMGENIRVNILGDRSAFDAGLQALFTNIVEKTASNTGLNLNIAINYGGRQDIALAVVKLAEQLSKGLSITAEKAEWAVKSHLMTHDLPDIDLLIRTGGEKRISNFLLWEASYAELYFTDVLWPDFSEADLDAAFEEFALRNRRFGGDTILRTVS